VKLRKRIWRSEIASAQNGPHLRRKSCEIEIAFVNNALHLRWKFICGLSSALICLFLRSNRNFTRICDWLINFELSKLSICSRLVLLSHFLRLGCCHLIILKLHCILEIVLNEGVIWLKFTCLSLIIIPPKVLSVVRNWRMWFDDDSDAN